MATTGILRSRRSAAQLHAIASVEREIRTTQEVLQPAGGCVRAWEQGGGVVYSAFSLNVARNGWPG